MKKIATIIAWMLFSLPSYAQLEIDYNYLRQQQKEIANTIRPELEAQARQNMQKTQQNQPQTNQSQMQLGQRQTQVQVNQQQAIENFNSRISNEGEQRMEYYNNPDNYIDRSITNRKSSLNNTNSQVNSPNRYNSPNQYNDLRTRPIHSEELTSKSLQMLGEANREYFSNEDRETTIDPNAQVPLFDAPSLGKCSMKSIEDKEMSQGNGLSKDGEIWDEMRSKFDEIQIQGIANAMKSTNNGQLPLALGVNDRGDYIFESLPSEADLDDYGHYDRVYSVSPDGVLTYATFDEHFFNDDNIIEMIQNGEIKDLINWDKKIGNSFNLTDLKNHPEKLEEIKTELKLSLFDNVSTIEVKRMWFAGKNSAANALAPDNSSYYIGIGGGLSSGLKATAKVGVSAALTNPHFKPTFSAGITATEVKAVGQFGTIQKIGNQFLQCDRTFQLKGSTNIDYRLYKILSIKGGYSLGCKIITTPENKFPSNKR